MVLSSLWNRCKGRYQRTAAAAVARRPFTMCNREPLISFTFDDFPRSALSAAGRILENHGAFGTYYTSLGLMGQIAPTGEMFTRDDLSLVLQRGHELGCHTFAHCHAYDTSSRVFEGSILANRRALGTIAPEAQFKTLSYPISCPRPSTKKRIARYFLGCRGGGQTYNSGTVDLSSLRAFFIEQSRDRPAAVKAMIDANCLAGGWLIFATHDVCENPTRYGCHPDLFAEIVRYCAQSGARLLPVSAALANIGVASNESS
jgi:peptidoglycan/xylan/chitin deacetylase (PgdA/CDA1 family)